MPTNYVLIDYENVQPGSLAGLDAEHFRVLVFVGASQNKLTFDIAAALQKLGPRAEYIRISGNGANALDFHIAFYIGQLSAQDPQAVFHIISKDTGFDPLIQHLRDRRRLVSRSKSVSDISLLTAASEGPPEMIDVVVAYLQQRGASRPRTIRTLTNSIRSRFQKQLSDQDVAEILESLQGQGYITVNQTKVTYELPESEF